MKVNFPSDYQQVMPYLIVQNAAGFISFMQKVFGATEKVRHMRDEQTIRHGEVLAGDSVIMFSDTAPGFDVCNAAMFIYVADADAAYEKAIAEGAKSIMPVSDQSYGRSGGVIDPFGNTWWITAHMA